ncbi:MAG: NarK/NasA family nitrate transporter [Actinomycetales bacterium]|nr:NarK/NasA family nitrate transporter [Actinomycetales bacterium]
MTTHAAPTRIGKDWLPEWDPEATDWDSGRAWKTLWVTTFSLTLAFITWFLASAIAPKLNSVGFDLSKAQLYWLIAMPGLAGGSLRLVWTFLPPIMGTRKLVTLTSGLFLIPLVGWALAVQNPETPFSILLILGALAGLGGGAFSGLMPSTSYFFPRSKQGMALGLQAGIGNFGVSIVQFVTPWIIGFALIGGTSQILTNKVTGATSDVWFQNAGYIWVPFVLVGTLLAWILLRSVPVQTRGLREQLDIFKNKHTWIMTYLYVITFGTFSGLAAGFALLINNIYGTKVFGDAGIDPLKYAFLGALVGSLARVISGPVADRVGGGKLTVLSALGIAAGSIYTALQLSPSSADDFSKFLIGMLVIFFFAGVGNASTFKQMPMIFERRQAGGVIGWTSAIAAYGPFIFGVMLASISPELFFILGALFASIAVIIAWWFYARKNAEMPC